MELRDQKGLTEREFLEAYAKKSYPRPYLTADLVVFSEETGEILLVRRKGHPYLGCWALPGGFVNPNETVEQTAARELAEETGVVCATDQLTPVGIFSKPNRDPRGWVVTSAYLASIRKESSAISAGDDAAAAMWFLPVPDHDRHLWLENGSIRLSLDGSFGELAFDHSEIICKAIRLYHQKRKEFIYV